jgi:hypothetical protein
MESQEIRLCKLRFIYADIKEKWPLAQPVRDLQKTMQTYATSDMATN